MADLARARRLAGRIQEVVADTLERGIKDPRLGMVTVTDVRMSADLHEATVFYTVYGDAEARAGTAAALASATGVLRSVVGKAIGVRHTPSLAFVLDALPDNAAHIDELLERARAADAEVHRAAEGARPAGDPDPYRYTAEESEEAS